MSTEIKQEILGLTGDEAAAYAMRQIDPDVVAAYPITPQTEIVMNFSQYVADGLVHTEFVPVESEHSAMSACVGAAAAGARVMTATSSQGLALMFEILYIASALRLPIIMPVVNRALSGNINIHCDHADAMAARDSGWIQIFSENPQEVYDNIIQAVRIGEHSDIRLPVMVNLDGFITSHGMEGVLVLPDDEVKKFVGENKPPYSVLDWENPVTIGPLDLFDYYFEHKRAQMEVYKNVIPVVERIGEEFGKISGRKYGIFEYFGDEDPDVIIVSMGSTAGTVKYVTEKLNNQGKKIGALKLRLYRPFPYGQIAEILLKAKAVAVLDRVPAFGTLPPLFSDIRTALYEFDNRPVTLSFVYGLGGRDIRVEHIEKVIEKAYSAIEKGKAEPVLDYLGVREG